MMKYFSRRVLFFSALYVCIIFGIFALQFTRGNAFSFTSGVLRISGAGQNESDGTILPVLPLHIATNGVDFFLDEQNPALAYTSSNKHVPLVVTSFNRQSDDFIVGFSNNITLSFSSEIRGEIDIVTISVNMPSKYQKVALPYKITRSAHLEKADSQLLIVSGKEKFYFPGIVIDEIDRNEVRQLPIYKVSPVVQYRTWIPVRGLVVEDLVTLPAASESAWKRSVEQYASASLVSFRAALASGSITEPLVASYISEMGRIGMYQAGIEAVPLAYRNGNSRTWKTNTFLNNLEKTTAGLIIREREDRTILSRKISDSDPSCFEFPSLVPYLIDRGSSVLLKDLAKMSSSLDFTRLTSRQAAGILEIMLDYPIHAPSEENRFNTLVESCERVLKSSLVRIGDNLYLSDNGNEIQTLPSLEVANILIRYGSSNSTRAYWSSVGRLLVNSLVSFAGDKAILPARFAFIDGSRAEEKSGIVAKADQVLDIADVYDVIVSSNTWIPHSYSLSNQMGSPSWAWTSAQDIKIAKQPDSSVQFSVRFPQGLTHYMVLRGIKPFYRIQIYGLDFRTDPRFESYNSSGYRYNEETETLYLKMRHKSEIEHILIWFGKDPYSKEVSIVSEKPVEEEVLDFFE